MTRELPHAIDGDLDVDYQERCTQRLLNLGLPDTPDMRERTLQLLDAEDALSPLLDRMKAAQELMKAQPLRGMADFREAMTETLAEITTWRQVYSVMADSETR